MTEENTNQENQNQEEKNYFPHELLMEERGFKFEELPADIQEAIQDFDELYDEIKKEEEETVAKGEEFTLDDARSKKLLLRSEQAATMIYGYIDELAEKEKTAFDEKAAADKKIADEKLAAEEAEKKKKEIDEKAAADKKAIDDENARKKAEFEKKRSNGARVGFFKFK